MMTWKRIFVLYKQLFLPTGLFAVLLLSFAASISDINESIYTLGKAFLWLKLGFYGFYLLYQKLSPRSAAFLFYKNLGISEFSLFSRMILLDCLLIVSLTIIISFAF